MNGKVTEIITKTFSKMNGSIDMIYIICVLLFTNIMQLFIGVWLLDQLKEVENEKQKS